MLNSLSLVALFIGAAIVAAGLGFFPRSNARSAAITSVTLLPLGMATFFLTNPRSDPDGLLVVVLVLFQVPWAIIALFLYNLVRRLWEIHTGTS